MVLLGAHRFVVSELNRATTFSIHRWNRDISSERGTVALSVEVSNHRSSNHIVLGEILGEKEEQSAISIGIIDVTVEIVRDDRTLVIGFG